MNPIHIVDRLTSTYDSIRNGVETIDRNKMSDLIKDARDRIHELEGLVYAYPPIEPYFPEGVTWRKEYEDLNDALLKMTPEEFSEWKDLSRYD